MRILRDIRALLDGLPARQSPEAWADGFTRVLEVLGWPGERTPDSAEHQLIRAWHKALDGLVSPARGQGANDPARGTLAITTQRREYRLPAGNRGDADPGPRPPGCRCHGFLTAPGCWGLNEESWPSRPHPNPFIPIPLQKQYGIPGADAGAALEQTRALQAALVRSTRHIILSHARLDEDRPLLASPLLQGLMHGPEPGSPGSPDSPGKPEQGAAEQDSNPDTTAIFNTGNLETIEDTQAPPVTGRYGAGGARLFQDQSQCPFRAFARHRLDSRGLDHADIGTDAMERGNLLHDLMQSVWTELRSQERLMAMAETELEAFIQAKTGALLQAYRKTSALGLYNALR